MAGLEQATESLTYPAVCATADGNTYTVTSAAHAAELGLSDKKWDTFRGSYREVGCRPYKDGRVSKGRQMLAEAEEKTARAAAKKPPAAPPSPKPRRTRGSSSSGGA